MVLILMSHTHVSYFVVHVSSNRLMQDMLDEDEHLDLSMVQLYHVLQHYMCLASHCLLWQVFKHPVNCSGRL